MNGVFKKSSNNISLTEANEQFKLMLGSNNF